MSQHLNKIEKVIKALPSSTYSLTPKVPKLNVFIAEYFEKFRRCSYSWEIGKAVSSFYGGNKTQAYQNLTSSTINKTTNFTNPPEILIPIRIQQGINNPPQRGFSKVCMRIIQFIYIIHNIKL